MRRVLTSAVVAAALALAVTACGNDSGNDSGDAGSAPAGSAATAEVSGTVTWWDTSDATNEGPVFQELIKDFEAKYPKIKVEYVNVPFADARDKFKTAAQSGSGAPDVLRTDVGWVAEFASSATSRRSTAPRRSTSPTSSCRSRPRAANTTERRTACRR